MPTDIKDLSTHTADLADFIAVQDTGGTGGKVALSSIMALGASTAFPVNVASATALTVGPNGTTDPTLTIDTVAGTCVTGIKVTGNAATSGVALAALSSGTDEDLTIDAKGTGTITLAGTSTGTVIAGADVVFSQANPEIRGGDTDGALYISPSTTNALGGNILLYGDTHATKANDIELRATAGVELHYDDSGSLWDFGANLLTTTGGATLGGTLTFTGAQTLTTTTGQLDISTTAGNGDIVITPHGTGSIKLVGAGAGVRYVQIVPFNATTDCATGDGAGDVGYLHIPEEFNGMDLVEVHAECITAGTTGTMDVQIYNVTQAADMLTTKITIDSAETGSDTAAAAAVIDAANDDVAENDMLRVDVDAVHTTAANGLWVTLGFRLP